MSGTTSGVKIEKNLDDVDITLYQGKTVNFSITWGGTAPIDVTGFSAKLQARKDYSTPVLVEIIGAPQGLNGIITFSMTASASAAIAPFEGVYDLELVTSASAVHQVMSGKFKVVAEVTR